MNGAKDSDSLRGEDRYSSVATPTGSSVGSPHDQHHRFTLFVTGLARSTVDAPLADLFSRHGTVPLTNSSSSPSPSSPPLKLLLVYLGVRV